MKRERGHYYVGDRIIHRAWKTKGTVKSVPDHFTALSELTVEWEDGSVKPTWVPAVMLDPEYVKELVKAVDPKYFIPKEGDRVKIPSIGIKGTVNFVNINDLYFDHYSPIQVILDKPYDDSGHLLYRTGLKDIKKLTKKAKDKVKKKKKVAPTPVEDDLLWDDDELEWA